MEVKEEKEPAQHYYCNYNNKQWHSGKLVYVGTLLFGGILILGW